MATNSLLHPENLSADEISSVLKNRIRHCYTDIKLLSQLVKAPISRQLRGVDVKQCLGDKWRLMELYNMYVLPLPRRNYRKSRLGTLLSKTQLHHDKERSREGHVRDSAMRLQHFHSSPRKHNGDSLVPLKAHGLVNEPALGITTPDLSHTSFTDSIDYQRKTIKLSSPSAAATTATVGTKSKANLNEMTRHDGQSLHELSSEGPPPNKQRKKITWP